MEEVNTFTAPIAGQSLTTEPKGYSWERPSEMNEVPQVIDFYIDKLGDQAVMDDVFTALDNGFPLSILVDSILGVGVMEGLHTIDVSLIISPVLHEYILAAARSDDVNVKEHPVQRKEEANANDEEILKTMLREAIDKAKTPDEGTELLEEALGYMSKEMTPDEKATIASGMEMTTDETVDEAEFEAEEAAAEEEPRRGLMARRT
tara:strand:+ start:715 stop:1329 length:615 start_codon:yes stop_codon:yes gene_type:complete